MMKRPHDQIRRISASWDRIIYIAVLVLVLIGAPLALRTFYLMQRVQMQTDSASVPTSPLAQSVASTLRYPRIITLADNTTATIPARPVRILPANAGVTDILAHIVDPKRLVAIPVQAERASGENEYWLAHKELPRFDLYQAEPLLALAPDLVIASAFQDPNTSMQLRKARIPMLNLPLFETFDGMRAAIRCIGDAIDETERATKLLDSFNARLEKLASKLKGKVPVRVLGYSNYGNGFAVGAGGSQDEIIRAAGGLNAAAELNLVGPAPITFEQIVKLDPDVIAVCGDNGMESPQAKLLFAEPALRRTRAVTTRRIAVVPSRYFDALSPCVADAVEILAEQFHPELRGSR